MIIKLSHRKIKLELFPIIVETILLIYIMYYDYKLIRIGVTLIQLMHFSITHLIHCYSTHCHLDVIYL